MVFSDKKIYIPKLHLVLDLRFNIDALRMIEIREFVGNVFSVYFGSSFYKELRCGKESSTAVVIDRVEFISAYIEGSRSTPGAWVSGCC